MWFETSLKTRYELPDMLPPQVTQAHKQLDSNIDIIIAMNVSEVCLSFPRRVLKRAGVGDRCFWEAT